MDTRSWSPTSSRVVAERGRGPVRARRPLDGRPHRRGLRPRHPERLAGLVLIGPVYAGAVADEALGLLGRARRRPGDGRGGRLRRVIDRTADRPGVARDGPALHPRADAAASPPRGARRGAARGAALAPFETHGRARVLEVPALVVASHDEADPGHPYAVAEAYAERLPQARADQRGGGGVAARLAGRQALP